MQAVTAVRQGRLHVRDSAGLVGEHQEAAGEGQEARDAPGVRELGHRHGQAGRVSEIQADVRSDEHPPKLLSVEAPGADPGAPDLLVPQSGPRVRPLLHAPGAHRPDDLGKLPAHPLDCRSH